MSRSGRACQQLGGIVHGAMDFVVADAVGAPLLAITGDPLTQNQVVRQGFHIPVDQVTWPLPLVPLHLCSGLRVQQSPEAKAAEGPRDTREGSGKDTSDSVQIQSLVTEVYGLLQWLRIELLPFAVEKGSIGKGTALLEVLADQQQEAPLRKAGIVWLWLEALARDRWISHQAVAASHLFGH